MVRKQKGDTMKGSEKQINWALEIEAKYNHFVDTFHGGVKIECDDAKFWIENAQVSNITFNRVPFKFEAYTFLRSDLYVDNKILRQQCKDGLISMDAYNMILTGEVK